MPIFVLDVQVMNLIVKHILEAERNQTHMLLEKQTPPKKKHSLVTIELNKTNTCGRGKHSVVALLLNKASSYGKRKNSVVSGQMKAMVFNINSRKASMTLFMFILHFF